MLGFEKTKNNPSLPPRWSLAFCEAAPTGSHLIFDNNNCAFCIVNCALLMVFSAGIDFIASVNLLEEHDSEKAVGEGHF